MKKEFSNVVLYLSPTTGPKEKVAPLNDKTFIQRLQDLTEALQSLDELQRALLGSKQKYYELFRSITTSHEGWCGICYCW